MLCEYDALPGLGHACGHKLIATMGAGAGFALAPLMGELDGTLLVLGTPAEEGGAAMMTGTEVEVTPSALPYREIAPNGPLEKATAR